MRSDLAKEVGVYLIGLRVMVAKENLPQDRRRSSRLLAPCSAGNLVPCTKYAISHAFKNFNSGMQIVVLSQIDPPQSAG